MDSIRSQLKDMGFDEGKVSRAIESCPDAQTLEQVMEWLIAHEDEIPKDQKVEAPRSSTIPSSSSESENSRQATSEVAANQAEAELGQSASKMAAEKKITVEEARKIIVERQAKRAEEERKKEIEDEKRRRVDGQKMAEMRAEMANQERVRLAQQIRKEKMEKELHKKQLMEQIARDREAMKQKRNPDIARKDGLSSSSSPSIAQGPRPSSSECRIALRFPDGSNLVHKFSPNEQLAAVRLYCQTEKNLYGTLEFVVPPNKKFTNEMMDQTLESLGLCPASRLEVRIGDEAID